MARKAVLTILMLCIFGLFGFAQVVDLAVTKVEALGVEQKTARVVEDVLQSQLATQPLLRLVERNRLDALLQEQELQLSGITSAESAARAGNVLGVDKIVFGTISRYDSRYVRYVLSIRMVDVESATVESALTLRIRSDEELLGEIEAAVPQLLADMSLSGQVTQATDTEVYVSFGEAAGLAEGDVLSVVQIELVKDENGKVLLSEERPVANLVVEKVSPEGSLCRVLEREGAIEEEMTVRIGAAEIEKTKELGSLEVRSDPEGSNVFLNGQFVGPSPLVLRELEPGTYTLEIRSGEGYKPYTGRIVLRAGRAVTVERELERDLEVEDLIAFGKVPRAQTDPKRAATLALVPGLGAAYNGYKSHIGPLVMSMSLSGLGVLMGTTWNDPLTYAGFWIYAGSLALAYTGSILDAWLDSQADFIYPTYYLLSTAAGYAYWSSQTSSFNGYGVVPEIAYEGQRFFFRLAIPLIFNPITIRFTYQYRPLVWEHWFAGFGIHMWQVLSGGYGLEGIWSPAVTLSHRSSRFEGDLLLSPFNFSEDVQIGAFGRIDLRYFWSTSSGLCFASEWWWRPEQAVVNEYAGTLFTLGFVTRI